MAVTVSINGVTLNPQPADVNWSTEVIDGKLNGTEAVGAYMVATLKAPVDNGGTANWNWGTYDNLVLSSIVLPPPYSTMRDTGVTYNSGVVSRAIRKIESPPGGLVHGVEMEVLIIA